MPGSETEGTHGPKIVRGRVDSLSLYEVTDYELQQLEEGLPGSTYLTFSVFFLSVALSFIVALGTAAPTDTKTFTVFVVLAVVGAAAGSVLLVLWFKTRKRVSRVLQRIKDRCLPGPDDLAALKSPAGSGDSEETEASAG